MINALLINNKYYILKYTFMNNYITSLRSFLAIASFLLFGQLASAVVPIVTGFEDNFDGLVTSPSWVPEHALDATKVFTLTQGNGELKVAIDKNTGIDAGLNVYGFSSLSLDLSATQVLNLANNPIIKIRIKADKIFKFNVGPAIADSLNNAIAYNYPDSVKGDGVYRIYTFDFTGKFGAKYDPAKINKIYLNFNAGWGADGKFLGNVTFDYIRIGDNARPAVVTSYVDNFDGAKVLEAWQPEHKYDTPPVFTLTQSDGTLKVAIDKNTGIDGGNNVYGFSSLSLDLSSTAILNLKNNPIVKIRLKATKAFLFNVGASQVDSATNNVSITTADSIPGDGVYRTYTFDFTNKFVTKYDSTKIDKLYLNFNGNWAAAGKYAGTVTFDFLKIGDAAISLPAVTSYVDNFDGATASAFWVPEHANEDPKVFTMTQANGALLVNIDKNTGIDAGKGWYGFSSLSLDMSATQAINMKTSPYIQIKLKADAAFTLGVGPVQAENGGNDISQNVSVPGDNTYHTYTIDFRNKFVNKYDSTKIDKLYLNFNGGWGDTGKYLGNVTFDFLKIGDAALSTGLIDTYKKTTDLVVYPNPVIDMIGLKNVSAKGIKNITINNINGQVVKQITTYDGGTINVQGLGAGVYFVKVTNGDNTINTLRFIKR